MWRTSEHQSNSLCGEQVTIKVQSSSVLLVKLEGTVLMATLLGTVVTVLVAWTEFWYKIGSPSFGTKLVDTIEAIYRKKGESSVATIEAFLGRFPIWIWEICRKERFRRKAFLSYRMVCMVSYGIVWYVSMVLRAWSSRAWVCYTFGYFGCLYVLHNDASDADCWVLLDLV